jgi:hypothetical protein
MSDIRLNSQSQSHAINDLTKIINFKGYDFFFNSPMSSRGVGILISKKVNYTVEATQKDDIGNILVIKMIIDGLVFVVGSVYGPNDNNMDFFITLEQIITAFGSANTIVGGDWNLIRDPRQPGENIDIINIWPLYRAGNEHSPAIGCQKILT